MQADGAKARSPRKGRTTEAIVAHLTQTGASSRAELSRELGHSASTISSVVAELLEAGFVEELPSDGLQRSVGRPGTLVRVRIDGCLLGIEFDHRLATVAVANAAGDLVERDSIEVAPAESARLSITAATELSKSLLAHAGFATSDVRGIGVAVPAPVDQGSGVVGSGSLLPNWREENVPKLFAESYGDVPTFVDNDANLAAIGEMTLGVARDRENFIFVKAATGLGGAICIGREIYRGPHGAAGELGHMAVPGERIACWCGNLGCLETVSSVPALLRQVAMAFPAITGVNGVRDELARGNRAITRTLFDMGSRVGMSVAQLCTVLDIDHVVVGGELVELADDYLHGLSETAHQWVHPQLTASLSIEASSLHSEAGMWGSLVMARQVASRRISRKRG